MRCCPQCGYVEPVYFLPCTWDVEREVAPYSDFEAVYHRNLEPLGMCEIHDYTYRRSRDGRYVLRLPTAILMARGGKWYRPRTDWDSDKQVKRRERKR